MWTLRYRSGDTALTKILNCVLWEPRGATLDSVPVWWWWGGVGSQQSHWSGAGVRLHSAFKGRGPSQWRKEHRWDLETLRQAVQLRRRSQSWVMGLGAGGRENGREEGRPSVS